MRLLRWAKALSMMSVVGVLAGCCIMDPGPQANFGWSPTEPFANSEVRFSDQSTDAGGPMSGGGVVAWSWDFGDGQTSTSRSPVHRYDRGGTYTVRLTVVDDCGNSATTQKSITVRPSVTGTWTGSLWDAANRRFDLILELRQTDGGGIVGDAVVTGLRSTILSASFVGGQVRITFAYAGTGNTWLLVGTYDSFADRLTGHWENITRQPGVRMGSWEVTRR